MNLKYQCGHVSFALGVVPPWSLEELGPEASRGWEVAAAGTAVEEVGRFCRRRKRSIWSQSRFQHRTLHDPWPGDPNRAYQSCRRWHPGRWWRPEPLWRVQPTRDPNGSCTLAGLFLWMAAVAQTVWTLEARVCRI